MPAPIADYVALEVAEHYPELALIVTGKAQELLGVGGPANGARAAELLRAFAKLTDEFESIAQRWAVRGTAILRERERNSRVRPDTLGSGGPRLGDYLVAEAIPQVPGSVGVANEPLLDDNVPWWPTNEFGSSTQVDQGRILFGAFFQPGPESRPSGDEYQEHALFEPRGRGEFRGSGAVVHPIQAKRFIEAAHNDIRLGWSTDMDAAIAKFIAELP